jgi:serine/threonine protein kinase
MIVYSAKFGQLLVDDAPFASGGAGQIYRGRSVSGGVSYCVKIIVSPKPDEFDKIRHMVDNPPATTSSGWGQLCWPLDLISTNESGVPQGYVMPMAEAGSVELSNLTVLRWPSRNHSPLSQKLDRRSAEGMARRMLVACNIAAAVQEVHRMGCVFVDLKPQNVLIGPQGAVSLVDLDSLQLSTLSRTYHGPLGSPEYMPPESYGLDFSSPPVISPSWDLFSLAVIIYEMLFGIHPFTASANPSLVSCETIDESIRLGMYVHGKNRDKLALIPAPHEALKLVPAGIVDLFRRAFDSVGTTDRPSAQAWGEALKAAADAGAAALPAEVYGPKLVTRPAVTDGQAIGRGPPWRLTSPCHGQYGKSCPYESENPPRPGVHAATLQSGMTVHLCDFCYKSHTGQPVPAPAPKPPLKYEMSEAARRKERAQLTLEIVGIVLIAAVVLYFYDKKKSRKRSYYDQLSNPSGWCHARVVQPRGDKQAPRLWEAPPHGRA